MNLNSKSNSVTVQETGEFLVTTMNETASKILSNLDLTDLWEVYWAAHDVHPEYADDKSQSFGVFYHTGWERIFMHRDATPENSWKGKWERQGLWIRLGYLNAEMINFNQAKDLIANNVRIMMSDTGTEKTPPQLRKEDSPNA